MNMVTGLAVYASVWKEQGLPLRFPGTPGAWTALLQATDTNLLARAVHWALDAPTAVSETFNVINGDHFRWKHLWADLGRFFDMPCAHPRSL